MDSRHPDLPAEKPGLFSEQFEAFFDALECLYIIGNQSGRIKFLSEWPAAAPHVFGEDLMRIDHDGADPEGSREALEIKAENAQMQLIETLESLKARYEKEGLLPAAELEPIYQSLGAELMCLVFAPAIAGRFDIREQKSAEPTPEEKPPEQTIAKPIVQPKPVKQEKAPAAVTKSLQDLPPLSQSEAVDKIPEVQPESLSEKASKLVARKSDALGDLRAQRIVHAKPFATDKKKK